MQTYLSPSDNPRLYTRFLRRRPSPGVPPVSSRDSRVLLIQPLERSKSVSIDRPNTTLTSLRSYQNLILVWPRNVNSKFSALSSTDNPKLVFPHRRLHSPSVSSSAYSSPGTKSRPNVLQTRHKMVSRTLYLALSRSTLVYTPSLGASVVTVGLNCGGF